jgi:uncharacterized repeat protein (TIGR01451 family)
MCSRLMRSSGFSLAGCALLMVFILAGWATPVLADNGATPPAFNGVSASMVRTNAQQIQYDPPLDVFGSGGSCPDPVNYGFDYGDSIYVWLAPTGDLWWVIETHGNIGDSDQDGGYNTENATCGGHPDCVNTEADAFNNIFASGVESITIGIDRDCNGVNDLRFTLTGSGNETLDQVRVTLDAMTDFFGDTLGVQGTAWSGDPIQEGPDAVCVVQRNGAVMIQIPDWEMYFRDPVTHELFGSPTIFSWLVDSGNNSDFYTEDTVEGLFDVSAPAIFLDKQANPTLVCTTGDSTRFTVTVTNTGNTPLSNIQLTDQLPPGLTYGDEYIDDPTNPIGAPTVLTNNLSWTAFSMEPGESRTVSYRVLTDGCAGTVDNLAVVTAEFDSPCLPLPSGLREEASASVTCAEPAVQVIPPADTKLCVLSPVSLTFVATNTGSHPEDLTFSGLFDGVAATVNPTSRNNVAPGDTVHVVLTATMPGTCSGDLLAEVHADGSVVGLTGCTGSDDAAATVHCSEPGVSVTPPTDLTACVETPLNLEFVITNTGNDTENLSFSGMFDGSPATVIPTSRNGVAPGDTVHVIVSATMPSTCSGDITVSVTADASVDGLQGCDDSDTQSSIVHCADAGVDVAPPPDTKACVDSTLQLTFVVTNTGNLTEDLSFAGLFNGSGASVNPASRNGVAAGDTVHVVLTGTMPAQCSGDVIARVDASATIPGVDLCDATDADSSTVQCAEAAVDVAPAGQIFACLDSDIAFEYVVTNTSSEIENLTFSGLFGGAPTVPAPAFRNGVAPGDTVHVILAGACSGRTVNTSLTATAVVDGLPGCEAEDSADGSATCATPGVTVTPPADITLCVDSPVVREFVITNTGTDAEDLTFSGMFGGSPATVTPTSRNNLAAGDTVHVVLTAMMPSTCSGDITVSVTANASVTGLQGCDNSDTQSSTVHCVDAEAQVTPPPDTRACVDSTLALTFVVTNTGNVTEDLSFTGMFNGAPATVNPTSRNGVAAGDTVHVVLTGTMPSQCGGDVTARVDVSASVPGVGACDAADFATSLVECAEACVNVAAPELVTACAGAPVTAEFIVQNCGNSAEDLTFTGTFVGVPTTVSPTSRNNVAPGDTVHVLVFGTMPADCDFGAVPIEVQNGGGSVGVRAIAVPTAELDVVATITGLAGCEDRDTGIADLECVNPDVLAEAPPPDTLCVDSPVVLTYVITNTGSHPEDFTFIGSFNGSPATVTPSVRNAVAPGDTVHAVLTATMPSACNGPNLARVIAQAATGIVACDAADTADVEIGCADADVDIAPPDPTTACASSMVALEFVVTNTGNLPENMIFGGSFGTDPVPVTPDSRNNVAPGDTVHVLVHGQLPGSCNGAMPARLAVTAQIVGLRLCAAGDIDSTQVDCAGPCVTVTGPPMEEVCPGSDVWSTFVVENCGNEISNLTFTGMFNGSPAAPVPASRNDVAPGDTVHVMIHGTMPAECEPVPAAPGVVNAAAGGPADPPATGAQAKLVALSEIVGITDCAASDSAYALIACKVPNVSLVKDTSPDTTETNSMVTITVENTGNSVLDPVLVSDHLPVELGFDTGQVIGGTCGASLDHVETVGDMTWVYFSGFSLDPGQSCTISYEVGCRSSTGEASIDTAYVDAWCEGTFGIVEPVSASDTAAVVCRTPGEACPRTIGFWRQQCAQKGNGSTKICEAGMESLWVCVINATDVVQWKLNDGGYETTAYLRTLSPADLFDHLCDQLQGPRPMTIRDMTEVQYLGLMLNVCSPALAQGIPVNNSFVGTVGEAIDGIENALNTGQNLGYWEGVADQINNGIGVLAADCPDGNAVFQGLPGCDAATPDQGLTFLSGMTEPPKVFSSKPYPNPVFAGQTIILVEVPEAMGQRDVRIDVYDLKGAKVRQLYDAPMDPGRHTVNWDLRDQSGSAVASGIYFYRVVAGDKAITQKMLVMRQ